MNGLSLIFAVVVIITVAVVAGVVVMGFVGGARMLADPPWKRRKTKVTPFPHHN